MSEILKKIVKNKTTYFILGGILLILLLVFFVLIPFINKHKIDDKWKTKKITISLSDGNSFDVEDKEMVSRIQKYCNDGLFRPVSEDNRIDGSCAIWVDFNNGTIIGMFQTRDYGYIGNTKQYIGDATYLPSGFNEFIRNLVKLYVNFHSLTGEITEIYKLGYMIDLDDESSQITDTDTVYASTENMTFSDIKNLTFEVGDTVKVFYNGTVIDSYPAQIYISGIDLVQSNISKEKEEATTVLADEDIELGYEIKDTDSKKESANTFYNFKQVMFNDTSITQSIPNWVMAEKNIGSLYSINNIDLLVDIIAQDKLKDNYGKKWSKEQKENIVLGQGIKCFNLDDDRIFYYYPMILNGNIVGLLELEETETAEYYASLTIEFVNTLNEIYKKTSIDNPLILFRYQNNICGLIDDTVYAENDIDVAGIHIPEITRSSVVDVLENLEISDIGEDMEDSQDIDIDSSNSPEANVNSELESLDIPTTE